MGGAHGVTRPASNSQPSTLNFFTLALRWSAGIASVLAVALTAIHVITPQMAVSERTLALARQFLVPSRESDDFAHLAAQSIWSGQPLKVLLQHTHLANYNRTLVNWKLEDDLYRDFVLSPEIVLQKLPSPGLATNLSPSAGEEAGVRGIATPTNHPSTIHSQLSTGLKWRRELWEYFYPRIRRESTPGAAAEIVGREVREKIALAEAANPESILEIWRQGRASATGRARLQVAAWRAVGIPARLHQSDHAEFWNGSEWVK